MVPRIWMFLKDRVSRMALPRWEFAGMARSYIYKIAGMARSYEAEEAFAKTAKA